jgi:oligopeptide transport system ATP-binding protein
LFEVAREMTLAISILDASVRFGTTIAVDHVSLDIPTGTTFGIVGESGSGKTTLLRAILGLQALQAGEILIQGKRFASGWKGMRERAHIIQPIFQDPAASLSPRCRIGTLMDEVSDVLQEPRSQTRSRLELLLHRLGVEPQVVDKYPHQISGGQSRRIAVVRALLMKPTILVADEPTAGLDVSVQGELLNLLQDLRKTEDITIIVISHNLAIVRLVADYTAVMKSGKVVEVGEAGELFSRPRYSYTQELIASWPSGPLNPNF